MKITDYAVKARSLNFYPAAATFFGPAFGICGETGELVEKIQHGGSDDEIIKEMGDVLWYLVNTLEDIQWSFVDCVSYFANLRSHQDCFSIVQSHVAFLYENDTLVESSDITELHIYSAKIAEIAKKALRDNNGVVPDSKRKVVGKYCMLILQQLCIGCHVMGLNLDDVAQANIDKLFDRRDRGVLGGSGDAR